MPSIDEAREAKAKRDAVLYELAEGDRVLSAVLRHPPEPLAKTDLYDILLSTPGLGREGVRQVCERARVWPHTHMKDLSSIQRALIIKALPKRVD